MQRWGGAKQAGVSRVHGRKYGCREGTGSRGRDRGPSFTQSAARSFSGTHQLTVHYETAGSGRETAGSLVGRGGLHAPGPRRSWIHPRSASLRRNLPEGVHKTLLCSVQTVLCTAHGADPSKSARSVKSATSLCSWPRRERVVKTNKREADFTDLSDYTDRSSAFITQRTGPRRPWFHPRNFSRQKLREDVHKGYENLELSTAKRWLPRREAIRPFPGSSRQFRSTTSRSLQSREAATV